MAERDLAASAQDPRQTRRWAREILRRWELGAEADRALLVLNELVTNALVHSPGGGVCRLTVDHGVLEVLVSDEGGGPPRRALRAARETPQDEAWENPGGRGLQIVGAVSDAWGIGWSEGRAGVWARWALPADWPYLAACVCTPAGDGADDGTGDGTPDGADDGTLVLASGGRVVAMPGPWEDADADVAGA